MTTNKKIVEEAVHEFEKKIYRLQGKVNFLPESNKVYVYAE